MNKLIYFLIKAIAIIYLFSPIYPTAEEAKSEKYEDTLLSAFVKWKYRRSI